jgi:hypothetical protein
MFFRLIFLSATLFLLVFLCQGVSVSAQQVSQKQKDSLLNNWQDIPGTTIRMIPPAYFMPFVKEGKYGFLHEGTAASVSAQEVPGAPYVMVVQALTKDYIEKQGMKFISREEVRTKAGIEAVIIAVSFKVKSKDGKQDVDYERLMLFTGDHARTIWVQGNYPVVVKKVLYLVIRESLLSVQF